jgi:thioredoxin-like negative regulator of GroEL
MLLVAGIALVYANSLGAPFIFDDAGAVANNPTIRRLASLEIFQPPADGSATTGRPLVNASLALNYAVSGDRVWSYHALDVALHALAALMLFGLTRRTLSRLNFADASRLAFATTLLWALHPLQTETVVCTAQRTELLCSVFYLLTLYAFVRGTTPLGDGASFPRRAWLILSVVACLLGMATKEVMVTAPLIVLLYDRTFVAKSLSDALRARLGFYVALAATWLLLAALVVRSGGARGASAGFGLGVTPWTYLLTQADALVLYLRLSFVPYPLVLDYGTAVAHSVADVWWQGLVVLALLASTLWALGRKPALGFLGAWFFLVLAPSSSVVPLVTQTIAEHRMYLPLAAVLIAVAVAAQRWLGSRALPVLTVAALVGSGATFARNHDYVSAFAMWSDNVAHRPHARVLTALGVELLHAGRPADALPHFERALALDPTHLSAQRNRGLALLQLGRADEAAALFAALPGREPGEAAEFFTLGNAFVREEKYAEAAAAYARTLTVEPDHAAAHANLGNIRLLQGRVREAIAEYETVLRLRPDDARARENLQLARDALR